VDRNVLSAAKPQPKQWESMAESLTAESFCNALGENMRSFSIGNLGAKYSNTHEGSLNDSAENSPGLDPSFEGSIIFAQPESVAINNFPKENNELASGSKMDA